MLIAVESHAFADNLQAIINRLGDSQHFEIARRQVAKKVEVVHLTTRIEERVFRIVSRRRRSHEHTSQIEFTLPTHGAGGAGGSAESS
jgi:hypothetical protein